MRRPAAESAYAAIVRLVHEAESDRAPFVRLADRYAAVFLPFTLAVAGIAWAVSGDPMRGLAVVVVATPCPLILAAPIAFVGGLSRRPGGIIVKGAGVLERLGDDDRPARQDRDAHEREPGDRGEVVEVGSLDEEEVLRLAASLDQLSAHVLAESLVSETLARGITLARPTAVEEEPGRGIVGVVGGRHVAVGASNWLEHHGYEGARAQARALDDGRGAGRAKVLVGVDGELQGVIVMADRLRPGAENVAGSCARRASSTSRS